MTERAAVASGEARWSCSSSRERSSMASRASGGRSPLIGLLLVLATAGCAGGAAAPALAPQAFDFARMADSVVSTAPLDRAHIGILVYDPESGRTLYEYNSERRFIPASNQKLWGTATALHELGEDYRYRTPVLGLGVDPSTGTAEALVVVGRGDPTLSARFHESDHTALEWLADSVALAGIRRVAGDLIIDASYFDTAIVPGSWTFGNLNGTSAPPSGAFVVAEGLYSIRVTPGPTVGAPAVITPIAPDGVEPVANGVVTSPPGSNGGTSNSRGPWDDVQRFSGEIALDAQPRSFREPMSDPVKFAAHVFADALRARGVAIDGEVRIVYDAAEAEAIRAGHLVDAEVAAGSTAGTGLTAGASATGAGMDAGMLPVREVAAWTSPPMREIVSAILGPSQNWIAEQLVRTLGAERGGRGSWRAGLDVETAFLFGTVGVDSNDGSGMSYQNLVTPRAVAQLFDYARSAPWGPAFRAALAAPGREGTLENRLTALEGRLEGKTGTLSNVNALSGYVRRSDGRELIFSIISNASGLPSGPVVGAIDQLVAALADGAVPH